MLGGLAHSAQSAKRDFRPMNLFIMYMGGVVREVFYFACMLYFTCRISGPQSLPLIEDKARPKSG